MKILVVGSGGREHALAWKLKQSPLCTELWCAPGNPGMTDVSSVIPFDIRSTSNIVSFANTYKIGLVVVGPEASLADGMANALRLEKVPVMGPNYEAARIETSKSFARNLMKKYDIPSPEYEIFTDASEAKKYVKKMMDGGKQVVVKADGLAAGKGAIVTSTVEEADKAIDQCLTENVFGKAGNKIVIEERLNGPEISILAVTDGKNIVILPPAQDHKPIGEGDTGLNTGGMGSYSPVPLADDQLIDDVKNNVLIPAIKGMESEGVPYSGVLYAGLMIHNGKPYVIEFNCRMGDPETQSVLTAVEEDLLPVFLDCAKEKLGEDRIIKPSKSTMCVVMSSGGYPQSYEKGKVISGLDTVKQEMEGKAVVFHAGTAKDGDNFVTAGGRVLGITGIGTNFDEATKYAYEAVDKISFDGAYYRKDIGYRVRN